MAPDNRRHQRTRVDFWQWKTPRIVVATAALPRELGSKLPLGNGRQPPQPNDSSRVSGYPATGSPGAPGRTRTSDPRFRNRDVKGEVSEDTEGQSVTTDLPEQSYGDLDGGPGLW